MAEVPSVRTVWQHPTSTRPPAGIPDVLDRADAATIAKLRKLDAEATAAPWAWREQEANWPKINSKVVFALAGFSPNDEPQCGYFQRRILQLRWSDVGRRIKQLSNVSPHDPDKALIVEMRNSLPALLNTIDLQAATITQLHARLTEAPNPKASDHNDQNSN